MSSTLNTRKEAPHLPEYWSIEHEDDAIVITKPWGFKAQIVAPATLALLILIEQDNPLAMWPALLLSGLWILVVLKNKTFITLKHGAVTISYGPIPFRPRRSYNALEAKKIWTKVISSQMRRHSGDTITQRTNKHHSYALIFTDHNNLQKTVIETNTKEQADFLEHSVKTLVDYRAHTSASH